MRSLRDLTGSAIGIFAAQAEAKQLSLRLDLTKDLPDAWVGDPTRLRQVLCNLLSNSIKFTPPHGRVVLRVADATPPAAGSVSFEVVDDARESPPMPSCGYSSRTAKAMTLSPAASAERVSDCRSARNCFG